MSLCLAPLASCAPAGSGGRSAAGQAETFQRQIAELQHLVEASLTIRAKTLAVLAEVKARPEQPVSSGNLALLKAGTEQYLELRTALYRLAEAYEPLLDTGPEEVAALGMTPASRLKAVMLSLGAALTLYDNYMVAIVLLNDDARLRRLLNDPDAGFGVPADKLTEVTLAANSIRKRHRMRQGISFCESEKARLLADPAVKGLLEADRDFQYLDLLLAQSPSLSFVRQIQVGAIAARKFDFLGKISADLLAEAEKEGVNLVSMLFGNTVGLCEMRKGKLYAKPIVAADLKAQLEPLDILLEKTPFRLTDKFIPGHFGHVAIWVGTQAELEHAGVWEHRVVRPYRDLVRQDNPDPDGKDGRQVLEALRDGVALNTLEHFLNVDDVLVLRPVGVRRSPEAVREALLLAFRQIGKDYDFNFDVNTTEKIVCSELAYVCLPRIDWPTGKAMGRDTISPDQVAQMALRADPALEVVCLYHDGASAPRPGLDDLGEVLACFHDDGARPPPDRQAEMLRQLLGQAADSEARAP